MAKTMRFVHGPFAQYANTLLGRTGHLWQNRFYSCPVEEHLAGKVLAYIERNPVRAGPCEGAVEFVWSSAAAHAGMRPDEQGLLDLEWWQAQSFSRGWRSVLDSDRSSTLELRQATRTGRPFGSKEFVTDLEKRLKRKLDPQNGGRPKRDSAILPGQGHFTFS